MRLGARKRKKYADSPRLPVWRGRFALSMQKSLLQKALAHWPRRAAPLLEVNCGDGIFLPLLWQSGFDVQASEPDAGLRARALRRSVPGLEIVAADQDDLPFEDDSFDWVIAHFRYGGAERMKACLMESMRLARRGMMFTFWNSFSLPALCWRKRGGNDPPAISWWAAWRALRDMHAGRISSMSTLCGPVFTWRGQCPFAGVNELFDWTPFGGWCIVRLDLASSCPLTPLPLRLGESIGQVEPALEYAQKRLSQHSRKNG